MDHVLHPAGHPDLGYALPSANIQILNSRSKYGLGMDLVLGWCGLTDDFFTNGFVGVTSALGRFKKV